MPPSKFVLDKKTLDEIEYDSLEAGKENKETVYLFFGNCSESEMIVKETKHLTYQIRKMLFCWKPENDKKFFKQAERLEKYRKKNGLELLGFFHNHPICPNICAKSEPSCECFSDSDVRVISKITKEKSKNEPYFVSALFCHKYIKTVFYSNFEILKCACDTNNEDLLEYIKDAKPLEVVLKGS